MPTALWILLGLFTARVLGQLLVVGGLAPFLPPLDDWQSGLLPYPVLLASQILILGVLGAVCVQFTRGRGYLVRYHMWLATPLWIVGWIYAVGMVVRYALLRRDAIPVVFHLVLASFLLASPIIIARAERLHNEAPACRSGNAVSKRTCQFGKHITVGMTPKMEQVRKPSTTSSSIRVTSPTPRAIYLPNESHLLV